MITTTTTPEKIAIPGGILPDLGIYVACLASYNNGRLHGAWVDLDGCSRDELDEAMAYVLATSSEPGAEEWAIHDYSGFPSFLTGSEWPDLQALIDYSEGLAEHHHYGEAYRLACENAGQVLDSDQFSETYLGTAETVEDFAMDQANDTGIDVDAAVWPFSCIDWSQAWRELELDGFHCERGSDWELHFFRN